MVTRAVRRAAADWMAGIVRIVFPPHCVGCGRPLGWPEGLCGGCRADLPLIGERCCPRCGRPVGPHLRVGTDCVECRRLVVAHLAAVTAAGVYEDRLRDMILQLKRSQRRDLTGALADLLAARVRTRSWWPEVVGLVAVPIHRRRRRRRGFNQARVLADALSNRLGRPVFHGALERHRDAPSQVGLSVTARVKNVAGTMRLRSAGGVAGAVMVVVDDVMTTGATLSECARVLRRGKAQRVYGAVLAVRHRAPLVAEDAPNSD